MSAEENKALYRRWLDLYSSSTNVDAMVDEFLDPNIIDHRAPPGTPFGPDLQKGIIRDFFTSFPNPHITLDEIIAEDDKVTVILTLGLIHQGEFLGIPPTGKTATLYVIE